MSQKSIQDMRREYGKGALREEDVAPDPLAQFQRWFDEAVQAADGKRIEANAMTLATCGRDAMPSARIVLLKEFDERGFTFYGNYGSRKGRDLAENPAAALLFHWIDLERQVRINGTVGKVSREEAEAYFHKRPRGNQLGAAASHQSRPAPSRQHLEERFAELDKLYEDQKNIPMPDEWGGWRLSPDRFEFWQGQASRLHDRIVYTRRDDGGWTIGRLSP